MKDCSEYEEQISQYLDGMLSWEEREELFAHLQQCSACRQLLEDLNCVSHQFYLLESPPPEPISQTVVQRMERSSQICRKNRIQKTILSIAAMICVVFLGAGAFWAAKNDTQQSGVKTADQAFQMEETLQGWYGGTDGSALASQTEKDKTAEVSLDIESGESDPTDDFPDTNIREEFADGNRMEGSLPALESIQEIVGAEKTDSPDSNAAEQKGDGSGTASSETAGALPGSENAAYFAVVTIAGQGESQTITREALFPLLEELKETGISYTYRTNGDKIDPDSIYALVCFVPGETGEGLS